MEVICDSQKTHERVQGNGRCAQKAHAEAEWTCLPFDAVAHGKRKRAAVALAIGYWKNAHVKSYALCGILYALRRCGKLKIAAAFWLKLSMKALRTWRQYVASKEKRRKLLAAVQMLRNGKVRLFRAWYEVAHAEVLERWTQLRSLFKTHGGAGKQDWCILQK